MVQSARCDKLLWYISFRWKWRKIRNSVGINIRLFWERGQVLSYNALINSPLLKWRYCQDVVECTQVGKTLKMNTDNFGIMCFSRHAEGLLSSKNRYFGVSNVHLLRINYSSENVLNSTMDYKYFPMSVLFFFFIILKI